MTRRLLAAVFLMMTLTLAVACTTPNVIYSRYQLEYDLLARYPDFFWCDPDLYPVVREGEEVKNSLEQFPAIRANEAEFSAILERLGFSDKAVYTDKEILDIYREHKKLTYIIQMTPAAGDYNFVLRIGEGQGFRIEGTITQSGQIRETKRESTVNTCPICLIKGTIIDTPDGPLPVEQIRPGMPVWTMDGLGKRVASTVITTSTTPVPPSFPVVKVTLNDGRMVTVSPGHPSAEGRTLGDYQPGEILDGVMVAAIDTVIYDGGETYDLLPSGPTGRYWANGILLGSTLTPE